LLTFRSWTLGIDLASVALGNRWFARNLVERASMFNARGGQNSSASRAPPLNPSLTFRPSAPISLLPETASFGFTTPRRHSVRMTGTLDPTPA